jgi:hypothetical protein
MCGAQPVAAMICGPLAPPGLCSKAGTASCMVPWRGWRAGAGSRGARAGRPTSAMRRAFMAPANPARSLASSSQAASTARAALRSPAGARSADVASASFLAAAWGGAAMCGLSGCVPRADGLSGLRRGPGGHLRRGRRLRSVGTPALPVGQREFAAGVTWDLPLLARG